MMYCQLEPLKAMFIIYGHWTPENTIEYQTFFLNKKWCFLGSCDHIHWFQWLQLAIHHGYVTQNGSHMHWNKQKDLKVMLEPKRSCTLLPGIHCIIFLLHTIETLWINYECLIYGYTLIQFSYSSIMNIITLLKDWSKVKTLSRRSSNHIYNSQKAFSEVIFNDTFHVTINEHP